MPISLLPVIPGAQRSDKTMRKTIIANTGTGIFNGEIALRMVQAIVHDKTQVAQSLYAIHPSVRNAARLRVDSRAVERVSLYLAG